MEMLSSFEFQSNPPFSFPILKKNVGDYAETEKCEATNGQDRSSDGADYSSRVAAVRLQKVYRSYRTRRRLADSVVVAEELWWQAIDYVRLNQSTISFFDYSKPETAVSRWNRVSLNASKVGKGLSQDAKAQKMAFQHWIEAIDPRHRYGHNLHLYYGEWSKHDSGQPFFYWLDIGNGKELDLKECPKSKLRHQCIKYLGPNEREQYEYIVSEGKIIHKLGGNPLDTTESSEGTKWIFVMSTSKKLYIGMKRKGRFHHSSFLAGAATLAAGRLMSEQGILKTISAYSGHYRPTDDSLDSFLSFLRENGVNLDQVQVNKATEDSTRYEDALSEFPEIPEEADDNKPEARNSETEQTETAKTPKTELTETKRDGYKRMLSGGLQSPKTDVPKKAILERINSKKQTHSYQLGNQLSLKWSTGAGPRIGCVADYPVKLRMQALELVDLSPRTPHTPSSFSCSPRARSALLISLTEND